MLFLQYCHWARRNFRLYVVMKYKLKVSQDIFQSSASIRTRGNQKFSQPPKASKILFQKYAKVVLRPKTRCVSYRPNPGSQKSSFLCDNLLRKLDFRSPVAWHQRWTPVLQAVITEFLSFKPFLTQPLLPQPTGLQAEPPISSYPGINLGVHLDVIPKTCILCS